MGKKVFLLFGGVLVIIAVLFLLYFAFISIGGKAKKWMQNSWEHFQVLLSENGPLLFLSIAVLPGFVLPVAPLLGFCWYMGMRKWSNSELYLYNFSSNQSMLDLLAGEGTGSQHHPKISFQIPFSITRFPSDKHDGMGPYSQVNSWGAFHFH